MVVDFFSGNQITAAHRIIKQCKSICRDVFRDVRCFLRINHQRQIKDSVPFRYHEIVPR